jgi:hypothetical protein
MFPPHEPPFLGLLLLVRRAAYGRMNRLSALDSIGDSTEVYTGSFPSLIHPRGRHRRPLALLRELAPVLQGSCSTARRDPHSRISSCAQKRRVAAGTATQRGKNWGGLGSQVLADAACRSLPLSGGILRAGGNIVSPRAPLPRAVHSRFAAGLTGEQVALRLSESRHTAHSRHLRTRSALPRTGRRRCGSPDAPRSPGGRPWSARCRAATSRSSRSTCAGSRA